MSKIMFHHNCLEQGGAERVISNLANRFCEEDEIIVATEWQGENEFELDSAVRRIHVGLNKADEQKGRIAKFFIRWINLRRLVKSEKPDVLIGFTRSPIIRVLMAGIGINVPVIIAVRADPWYVYNGRGTRLAIKLLFPRADGAVFQTDMQRSFFPKYLMEKSRIVLNPVNEKYFCDTSQIRKEKLVISTGRLVDFKNQAMLLRAFIKIHDDFPEYSLELFGDDSHDGTKEILEGIIKDNNAGEYIRLMGASNRLEKEIPRAELFAFASNSEGMPNSLLEAMCLGMPVVATNCPSGGPETIIEDGVNGLLTPVGDENAFADAITRVLKDKELAETLGKNAAKLRNITNTDAIVKEWREFIDETIQKRK